MPSQVARWASAAAKLAAHRRQARLAAMAVGQPAQRCAGHFCSSPPACCLHAEVSEHCARERPPGLCPPRQTTAGPPARCGRCAAAPGLPARPDSPRPIAAGWPGPHCRPVMPVSACQRSMRLLGMSLHSSDWSSRIHTGPSLHTAPVHNSVSALALRAMSAKRRSKTCRPIRRSLAGSPLPVTGRFPRPGRRAAASIIQPIHPPPDTLVLALMRYRYLVLRGRAAALHPTR